MNGKLIKLRIIAFNDASYSKRTGEEYETSINPDSYAEEFRIMYSDAQPHGASGSQQRYKATKPDVLGFTFLFDGTGVIPSVSPVRPVRDQIEQFKRVTLDFKGDIHQPRFLHILWGSLLFKGRLVNLKISYTLFSPAGLPLRAQATAGFKGSIDRDTQALLERRSSPDLTHVRIVEEGDTLPSLSQEIYGDPRHYLELARVNRLTNFRRLAPGDRLVFPPIAR